MSAFGDFLYTLRKEKNITQKELADLLGVTNKAVSKWETGDAMPETNLILPISKIFGVTADELLNGKYNENKYADDSRCERDSSDKSADDIQLRLKDYIKGQIAVGHISDNCNKTFSDKVCAAICAALFLLSVTTYLIIGALSELWHPYWILIPISAMVCGLVGITFDLANKEKREKKLQKGENPYIGAVCGIFIIICIVTYLILGVTTEMWHPLWIIIVGGALIDGVIGTIGEIIAHKKDK